MNINDKVKEIKEQLRQNLLQQFAGTTACEDNIKQWTINFLSQAIKAENKIEVNTIQKGAEIEITAANLYTFILLMGIERPPHWIKENQQSFESSVATYRFNTVKNVYECVLLEPIQGLTINCKLEYPK